MVKGNRYQKTFSHFGYFIPVFFRRPQPGEGAVFSGSSGRQRCSAPGVRKSVTQRVGICRTGSSSLAGTRSQAANIRDSLILMLSFL